MAHVIGQHSYKGRSNKSISARIHDQSGVIENGMAVTLVTVDPTVVERIGASGGFAGFVSDVNKDNGTCNLIIGSAGLAVQKVAGVNPPVGDLAAISPSLAIVGQGGVGSGQIATNAQILDNSVTVVDGATGVEYQGVILRFGMAEDRGFA